jgi:hypothetical protein
LRSAVRWFIEPILEILDRGRHDRAFETGSVMGSKELLLYGLLQGPTGCPTVIEGIGPYAQFSKACLTADTDPGMDDGRSQVNQIAFRPQHTPGLMQGMDHALVRNSSKRPAKYDDIERHASKCQAPAVTGAAADSGRFRPGTARLFDERLVRIDGGDIAA